MRPVTTVLVTVLLWVLPQVVSAGEPLWTREMEKEKDVNTEIKWHTLTESGTILIGGDFGIISLDPETGREIWQKRNLGKIMEPQVALLRGTPVMFVSVDDPETEKRSHLVAFNYMDGSEVWKSDELPGTTFGLYVNANRSQVVAVTAPEARRTKLAPSRKGELTINALDLAQGRTQWAQKLPGEKARLLPIKGSAKLFMYYSLIGSQSPVFEKETGIFAFNDQIVKYDMGAGGIIWTSNAKIEKGLEIVEWMEWNVTRNAPRISAEDDLYFSYDKRVMKISKQDGSLAWTSKEFDAQIHEMRLQDGFLCARAGGAPERVKVKGLHEVAVIDPVWAALDPASGKLIWKYDGLNGLAASMLFHKDMLFLGAGKKMVGLDPANGKRLKEIKLPEEGTTVFMPRGERVVALSQQGASAVDIVKGKPIWSQYYEAPGLPRWVKLASMAVSGFLALQGELQQLSAQADIQDLALKAEYGRLNMTSGQIASRIDRNLDMFGKGAGNIDAAKSLYTEAVTTRFTSAGQSSDHMFFLVKLKKNGPGLLGLNLETGEIVQEAPLETKDPDFEIDEVRGRVFVFQDQIVKALPLKN